MPQSTPNLSLVTYDLTLDAGVYFSTFRSTLAGYTNSALTKIDTWAGQVNADLTALKQSPSIIRVSATKDSDFVYSATVLNMPQYSLNQYINLSLDSDNVGTVSLNINALGGKSLLKFNNAGTLVNISAKDLRQGKNNLFTYNGTAWVWVNAISSDQLNIAGTSGNLVKISADNTLEDSGATFSNSVTNNAIVQRTATGQIKGATASANDDVVNKLYADTIDNKIGDLSTLTTTDKSNLVGATNELNSAIGQNTHDISQLSNPSLTINEDFQIWQRGTSFANIVDAYTADRWKSDTSVGSITVTKTTDGIKVVNNSAGYNGIAQILEPNKSLVGEYVTLSCLIKSNCNIYAVLRKISGGVATTIASSVVQSASSEYKLLILTTRLDNLLETDNLMVKIQFAAVIGEFEAKYAKLELGKIATPLSPRPVGEGLVLCQRYYEKRNIFGDACWSAYYLYNGLFYFSTEMRVTPTITFFALNDNALGKVSVYNADATFNKNATVLTQSPNSRNFRIYGNAEFIPGTTYIGCTVVADAEIY